MAISPGGTLSFSLDPLHLGFATFNVTLEDEGGVMRGGENAADVQEFTITVPCTLTLEPLTLNPSSTLNAQP